MYLYVDERTAHKHPNGSVTFMAGAFGTLSKVTNCPVPMFGPDVRRTVRATGYADTFFSVPAECSFRGKTVRGYLTTTKDPDGFEFRPYHYGATGRLLVTWGFLDKTTDGAS